MRRALVIAHGFGEIADFIGIADFIRRLLEGEGISAGVSLSMPRFGTRAQAVAKVDVAVLVINPSTVYAGVAEAFRGRVAAGLGVVAMPWANIPAKHMEWVPWGSMPGRQGETILEVVGSRFSNFLKPTKMQIEWLGPHPVTEGLEPFAIRGRPLEIEWLGPEPEVVAVGRTEDARTHPFVYVREYGRGRVGYVGLGLDGGVWDQPSFRRLLVQAVRWAGRES